MVMMLVLLLVVVLLLLLMLMMMMLMLVMLMMMKRRRTLPMTDVKRTGLTKLTQVAAKFASGESILQNAPDFSWSKRRVSYMPASPTPSISLLLPLQKDGAHL